jgi:hypothetical protein
VSEIEGTGLRCPGCDAPFRAGAPACPSCGLKLSGATAAKLWQVDQQLATLQRRRQTLLGELRFETRATSRPRLGDGPAAAPATAPATATAPAAAVPAAPVFAADRSAAPVAGPSVQATVAQRPPHRPASTSPELTPQVLLLGLGALLLLTASIVFVAVAWDLIGLVGQVLVLLTVTLLIGAGSVWAERRRLTASAEWLAALAVGMLVVDLLAARAKGLGGLESLEPGLYTGVAALVVAFVVSAAAELAPRIRVYPLVGIAALWLGAVLVVDVDGVAGTALRFAAAALVLGSPVTRRLRTLAAGRPQPPLAVLWWPPLLTAVAAVVVATIGVADTGSTPFELALCLAVVLVLLVPVGAAVGAHRTLSGLSADDRQWAVAVWAVIGVEAGLLTRHAGDVAPLAAVLVVAACLLGVIAVRLVVAPARLDAWVPQVLTVLGGAGSTVLLLVVAQGEATRVSAAAAVVSVVAAAAAVAEPRLRVVCELVSGSSGLLALGLALGAADTEATVASAVTAAAALVLTGLAAVRKAASEDEETALGVLAVLSWCASIGLGFFAWRTGYAPMSDDVSATDADGALVLTAVLAVAAVAALGYALLPARGSAVFAGTTLGVLALWVPAAQADAAAVEWYTVPAGAWCLLVAVVARLRSAGVATSWIHLPAVAWLLLPSAAVSGLDDELRFVGVLAAGVGAFAAGLWRKDQALLAVAAGALGLATVMQAGDDARLAFAFLVITVLAVALTLLDAKLRSFAELVAVVAGQLALGFALRTADAGLQQAAFAYLVVVVGLAALAAVRRVVPGEEEAVLATGAALAATAAIGLAYASWRPALAGRIDTAPEPGSAAVLTAVLAILAAVAFAYAFLPRRGPVALLGTGLGLAALWVPPVHRQAELVEAYTLPAALMLAVVGVVGSVRSTKPVSSWAVYGTPAALALLPSALLAGPSSDPARVVLVTLGAAAVLGAGLAFRAQAPVTIGSIALVTVAVLQLAPVAAEMPRWITLGSVGLALLIAGVMYEKARQGARAAQHWYAALT